MPQDACDHKLEEIQDHAATIIETQEHVEQLNTRMLASPSQWVLFEPKCRRVGEEISRYFVKQTSAVGWGLHWCVAEKEVHP